MPIDPDDRKALSAFFKKLKWSDAHKVAEVRREVIPDLPGIYIFTRTMSLPTHSRNTLYVGKTDGPRTSLRARLWGYCVMPIPNPQKETHAGRRQIFQYRMATKIGIGAFFS